MVDKLSLAMVSIIAVLLIGILAVLGRILYVSETDRKHREQEAMDALRASEKQDAWRSVSDADNVYHAFITSPQFDKMRRKTYLCRSYRVLLYRPSDVERLGLGRYGSTQYKVHVGIVINDSPTDSEFSIIANLAPKIETPKDVFTGINTELGMRCTVEHLFGDWVLEGCYVEPMKAFSDWPIRQVRGCPNPIGGGR